MRLDELTWQFEGRRAAIARPDGLTEIILWFCPIARTYEIYSMNGTGTPSYSGLDVLAAQAVLYHLLSQKGISVNVKHNTN
jgi:hypothetical protein